MVSQLVSTTLVGVEARFVRVEVDLATGLPGVHVVGLPDTAVGESIHRVRSALRSVEKPLPPRRVTVNLAPGDLRKEGPRFDLAIALGVLGAGQHFPPESLEDSVVLGELSLDGGLRPVRGVLNTALAMREKGLRRLLLPQENLAEVIWVEGLELWPAASLGQLLGWLRGESRRPPVAVARALAPLKTDAPGRLDEVVGQPMGRLALEVAAAGGHHLLWVGPPGCGKTLLSRCLPELIPDLAEGEAVEVAAVRSALGQSGVPERAAPLAEPHCRISATALLGGQLPGEVSRAHRGVLFLDEVTEFARDSLEGLRTAMESGWVEVGRARQRWRYPARFQLVAACNPCPCGFFGDPLRPCGCPLARRKAYLGKLSGPIRDRLDLQVLLARPGARECWALPQGDSRLSRQRVAGARLRQKERGCLNRDLSRAFFQETGEVDADGWDFLFDYATRNQLSARAMEKLLRVARTLADLGDRPSVGDDELGQAVHFRCLDRFE
ncbi:YifB family Mg chelatase-like AAA ATPase [bacterium]|nr:YifB family Mg chelatase-like AAA ATPase [bacterium]